MSRTWQRVGLNRNGQVAFGPCSTTTLPGWAALFVIAISLAAIGLASAQTTPQQSELTASRPPAPQSVPAAPADVVAAKAYAVLERGCAHCHQAGRIEGGAAAGGDIANLLALDEVARNPALVRPGVPDASRLYAIALTREHHLDILNDPTESEPAAADLQALRDWIADLPPRSLGACSRRPRITAEQAGARLEAALAALPGNLARQTRFVSLVSLYNDCATPPELDALRHGLRRLLAKHAAPGEQPRDGAWPAIDPEQLILAVPLSAIGWKVEKWQELANAYPLRLALRLPRRVTEATGTDTPLLPADWLAATLAEQRSASPAPTATNAHLWGLSADVALRHAWHRQADFNRAAADLWLDPTELTRRLASPPVEHSLAARQLTSGGTTRRHRLMPLLEALSGARSPPPVVVIDADEDRLEIALWSDSPTYRSGDTAVFNVAASRDCHLTLINVDRSGRATVLYPNEFEPENLIRAGRTMKVPSFDSPYRFRFKEKGRELMIAICSLNRKAPAGIAHDYDRLRFTMLGDWQLFLREPPELTEARRDDAATDTPRPVITQRRRGRSQLPPKAAPPVLSADAQTRVAITVDVE